MKRVSFVPGFKYYVHIQNIRISVTTMPSLQLAADCHTLKPARRRCGGTLGRCRKVWGGRVTVEREREADSVRGKTNLQVLWMEILGIQQPDGELNIPRGAVPPRMCGQTYYCH